MRIEGSPSSLTASKQHAIEYWNNLEINATSFPEAFGARLMRLNAEAGYDAAEGVKNLYETFTDWNKFKSTVDGMYNTVANPRETYKALRAAAQSFSDLPGDQKGEAAYKMLLGTLAGGGVAKAGAATVGKKVVPNNNRTLRYQIKDLSPAEQKLVKDFNAGFTPHGVTKEEALDFIFNTETGQAQLKSAKLGDPSADNATILNRVLEQVQSGTSVPIEREIMTPLVKIVPDSRNSAGYGPFFTTPEQLEIARNSGRSLSDMFGLPGGSHAEVYRVFQIQPKGTATVFESTIAPTTELNGKLKTQGGLQQFLVPNRNQFEDAIELDLIRDNN